MDDDLIRIVASAAAGLVIRVVGTAAWRQVRDRIATLLSKGDRYREQTVTTELDSAADQLADIAPSRRPTRARDPESELRGMFRTWLRTDPELVERLRSLVAEEQHAAGGTPTPPAVTVHDGIGLASGRDMTIGSVTNTPGSAG